MSLTSFMLKMMAKAGEKIADNLEEVTKDPMKAQKELLFSLLEANKDTELGKKLGYADIHSIEDFQHKIPLTDYDYYAEMIDRMTKGAENIITSDKVVHYNMTSGTLGAPKRIPINERHVQVFSGYYAKYLNYIASKEIGYDWANGKGLTLTEGKYTILPSGASCGSASSLSSARMGKMIPGMNIDMMGMMYTSPIEARQPKPNTPTRFLHALFALREPNITYGSATFSSYLLEFMRYIEKNWQMLTDIIRTGDFPIELIPDETDRKNLKKKLKPSPKRAAELEKIFSQGFEEPFVPKVWPNLKYLSTVGGAGFQVYTDKLREQYCGKNVTFLFLGLSASEGMFSVPFECENARAVFVPDSLFLEFLPLSDDGDVDYGGPALTMDQVEIGKSYELVVTHLGGFVRYKMKDVVEITGFHNATPTMAFKNRSGFAISMYGEKTSEAALQYMVQKTDQELKLDVYDYAVCPDDDEAPGKYVLCLEFHNFAKVHTDLETIRATAQKYLSEANPSIGKKMDTGIVKPLELRVLEEESFLLYRDLMIAKGRAAAQLKPVHVLGNPFLKKFFYKLCYDTAEFTTK